MSKCLVLRLFTDEVAKERVCPFICIPEGACLVNVQLEFKLLDGQVIKLQINKLSFIVGRSLKCDVPVPHEGLSRTHCLVSIENGEIYLTDLDSANGVLVNEVRIPPQKKTHYNPLFTLHFGGIEVTKISNQEVLEEMPQEMEEIPNARPPLAQRERLKSRGSQESTLHPSIKGLVVLIALALGYFLYTQIFEDSDLNPNDITRMQHEIKMKNRANDGSVKTRNF